VLPMGKHELGEREREIDVLSDGWQKGGEWTPPRSGSSSEGEKEGGMTLPPPRDAAYQRAGPTANERHLKRPWVGIGPSTDSPGRHLPM
jgi:hypothetical protein